MVKKVTFILPEFDDYTLESSPTANGSLAIQSYYSNNVVIATAEISFGQKDGETLKWPYKFVFTDKTGAIQTIVEE